MTEITEASLNDPNFYFMMAILSGIVFIATWIIMYHDRECNWFIIGLNVIEGWLMVYFLYVASLSQWLPVLILVAISNVVLLLILLTKSNETIEEIW
jgi:hypothetical protein